MAEQLNKSEKGMLEYGVERKQNSLFIKVRIVVDVYLIKLLIIVIPCQV